MKKTTLFAFLLFILALNTQAQNNPAPAEAKPFIPAGYESFDYIKGDLNGDKKPDAILVVQLPNDGKHMEVTKPENDTVEVTESARPLIILIRQANGKLKQVLRNDSAILCADCGGVFGDPYAGVDITNNGFSINFYGGSNWRWANTYWFSWNAAKKDWLLVKEYETSYHTSEPNKPTKDAMIDRTELEETSFAKFNANPEYEDSHWKVTAAKTFFYGSPKLGSKPRKGFLLKGDSVTGIRQLKNFVEVSYDDGKGNFTDGYVLRKDLEKL